jgi:hypothetical protein
MEPRLRGDASVEVPEPHTVPDLESASLPSMAAGETAESNEIRAL